MASLQKTTGSRADRLERKASNPPSPLPEKIALVLQESRWLALIVLAAFLGLALWGYNRADPGWSHAMQGASLHNPAGRGGAWLADLLLYLFGLSAWWWIALVIKIFLSVSASTPDRWKKICRKNTVNRRLRRCWNPRCATWITSIV